MVGALTLLVDGVADCFDVAARRDHAVNLQATSTLTRSVLEAAGQIAWLLERDIGGTERNRRYGIWLLSDLRQQRELLRDSPPDHKDTRAGHELVAAKESDLIAQLQLIGLSVRPSSADGKKAAVLLTNEGKPEGRPSMGTMVDLVAPSGAAYPLLSVAAHSYRLGILTGVKHRDSEDGGLNVDLVGFGVPAKLALGMTATALVQTSHLLAEWTGVDATKLNPELRRLARQMGFTPPR